MRRSSKRIWVGGAGAVGLLTGVISLVGAIPGGPSATAAELAPFDDCEQLRSWYVDAALPHVTAWGWETDGPILLDVMPVAARVPTPTYDMDAVGNGETGTNIQERDVDEPDLAKTNGALVAVIQAGDLVLYDTSDGDSRVLGRLDLPDRHGVRELLLVGDRVVLLGSTIEHVSVPPTFPVPRDRIGFPTPVYDPGGPRTSITTVDVSDPAAPSMIRSEVVEGELVSAREHNGTVRVVTTSMPDFDFVQPYSGLTPKQALAKNRHIVRTAATDDWLPTSSVYGAASEPFVSCADLQHPRAEAGLGTITVLTMDPDEPDSGETTGVAADGDLTYSSADRLYVATTEDGWSDWTWLGVDQDDDTTTDIHAFDVTGDETSYVGSGEVAGRVADRWAFSEDGGLLRVASTEGPFWSPVETRVTVLEERDGGLEPIGSVGGMGRGEQVEAVRWFGDVAVVVTFRQVDPLYTVDLSDPASPTVVGELKIPGFSAYLHPLGDDLILGVGQSGTDQGRLLGSQVSTFDLADLAAPQRLDQLAFGTSWYSAVESDSRAFTYLPDERLALVPVDVRYGDGALAVVRIDEGGDVRPVDTVELPGGSDNIRALPLDDGRVAIVAGGRLVEVVDPAEW